MDSIKLTLNCFQNSKKIPKKGILYRFASQHGHRAAPAGWSRRRSLHRSRSQSATCGPTSRSFWRTSMNFETSKLHAGYRTSQKCGESFEWFEKMAGIEWCRMLIGLFRSAHRLQIGFYRNNPAISRLKGSKIARTSRFETHTVTGQVTNKLAISDKILLNRAN